MSQKLLLWWVEVGFFCFDLVGLGGEDGVWFLHESQLSLEDFFIFLFFYEYEGDHGKTNSNLIPINAPCSFILF